MRRAGAGSKDFHLTHHSHAEKQSWRIPRTKVSSPAFCVDIPRRITCSSLTNLTVSSLMRRWTSRCVAICWRATASSAETVRIVCDDTDVFVPLVYWTWRKTIRKNTQMEKWDRMVLVIHATVVKLGDKCAQLPGMHALSGCDTVSYPYGKGKTFALKVLMNNDIDGLQDVLGEPDISQGQLKATVGAFVLALYGQKKTDSLNSARYKMYMSRKKPPPLKKLPLTDNNLQLHVLRAHLQKMLWKAAD